MQSPTFTYFDHDADIGVTGSGPTTESAFVAAAQGMFAIMVDIREIKAEQRVEIEFEEPDMEFALVTWLNLLLAEAREKGLVFAQFQLSHRHGHWRGEALGEPWRTSMDRGTEVKGATLTMLSVKQTDEGWNASCVVDV